MSDSKDSASKSPPSQVPKAWAPGGMDVFCKGFVVQLLPLIWLASHLLGSCSLMLQICWVAALIISMVSCVRAAPTRRYYFGLIIPLFAWSLPLVMLLPNALLAIIIAFIVLNLKIGICMSVCLHRYASHQAFTCGPLMKAFTCALGCLAYQGGPIWWASKHRCHHKHCDEKRDPHSAAQMGEIEAFVFFTKQRTVEEEYAPAHLESSMMRMIDTYGSLIFPMMELWLWHRLFGPTGLWIGYASSFLCQTLTLYFNLANHPPGVTGRSCLSVDFQWPSWLSSRIPSWGSTAQTHDHAKDVYVPTNPILYLLSWGLPMGAYLGEGSHHHHHSHATAVKRPGLDWPYHIFVRPLLFLGLVWNPKWD